MSIARRTDKSGKASYTVLVDTRDPVTNARQRHTVGTYRTRKMAERFEREAKNQIEAGTFVPKSKTPPEPPKVRTVADVVNGWLIDRKAHVTANTHSQYESAWRLHLKDTVGERDVTTLTRPDVRDIVRGWQQEEMGAQLQNRTLLVLRCALDTAVEDGILAANPATGIKLPSPKSRRDLPVWTSDDLAAFLAAGEDDLLGVFWYLTALEGMRRAEALGLRWRDMHWTPDETGCRAVIVQTVVPDASKGGAALVQPRVKTRESSRTVTLTAPTVTAMKRHRDRQAFRRRELGAEWPNTDLIVCNELGAPIRPDAVDVHRRAVIRAAGVSDVGTHGLRHHAATTMLRAGVSPAIVAAKLGHADIGVTVGTYGHLVAEDQSSANNAVEAFLTRANQKAV